jgi:hypothetical protein
MKDFLFRLGIWAVGITLMLWIVLSYTSRMDVTKHQEGNITYLIFQKSNSIAVVNYTADSLEYEFLHQPTKTNYGDDTDSAVQVR